MSDPILDIMNIGHVILGVDASREAILGFTVGFIMRHYNNDLVELTTEDVDQFFAENPDIKETYEAFENALEEVDNGDDA